MVDREQRDNPAPLELGELLLDRYRVVEQIGSGGHSLVFRGHDERLERPICIKVFFRLQANARAYEASYQLFIQEAFSLSKLAHPSTLRIYDFGHVGDAGPPFQITELMNGGTLTEYVRSGGTLPREEVAVLATAMCGALSEAHSLGIVHRDVKPGNILLSTAGATSVLKLADFGIAKALSSNDDTSSDPGRNLRMYSRRWAAPEQMTNAAVTPASDLYSLALVTIFGLTGRGVFTQKDPRDAYEERHASDELIDEVLRGAAISASARAVLKAACSFDPMQRPASADELGDALARALGEAPEPSPPPRPPEPPPRQRLHLGASPALVGDHRVHLHRAASGAVELEAGGGTRFQITLVPAADDGVRAHVKAVGGFVKPRGGRPSRAITIAATDDVDIVAPNGVVLASARIGVARREASEAVFLLRDAEISVSASACRHAVIVDFGDAADSALVFIPPIQEPSAPPGAP